MQGQFLRHAHRAERLHRLVDNILRHPSFHAWGGLLATSYGGLFTFLAASSFVFINVYGLSKNLYGLCMACASGFYILGTLYCRRLLPRVGLRGAVQLASGLSLIGGTVMGLLALAGLHSWWAFLLPFCVFTFGHGIHQPCAQTGAVAAFPQMAGTASALSGFVLTLVAFAIGAWLGWRIDGTVYPLVNGVWFWSVAIAFFGWAKVGRLRDVPTPPPAP